MRLQLTNQQVYKYFNMHWIKRVRKSNLKAKKTFALYNHSSGNYMIALHKPNVYKYIQVGSRIAYMWECHFTSQINRSVQVLKYINY